MTWNLEQALRDDDKEQHELLRKKFGEPRWLYCSVSDTWRVVYAGKVVQDMMVPGFGVVRTAIAATTDGDPCPAMISELHPISIGN